MTDTTEESLPQQASQKPLSPLDYAFLRMETDVAPAHVGSIQIFKIPRGKDQTFVYDIVKEWMTQDIPSGPFRRRLKPTGWIPGWPTWEDDPYFHLDNHLQHRALPKGSSDDDLARMVTKLHERRLPRKRPLWEIYVIEGLSDNRFAIYSKVHHAMIDGVGGIALMEASLNSTARDHTLKAPWAPDVAATRLKTWPGLFRKTQQMTDSLWRQSAAIPSVLWALVGPTLGLNATEAGKPFEAPITIFNGKISDARRAALAQLKIADVKAIADAFDVTINDVVLCCVAGALRHYLQDHGALPKMSLTATVPVGLKPERSGDEGNALAYVVVKLGTDMEDPVARLKTITASAGDAKSDLSSLSKPAVQTLAVLSQAFAVAVNHIKAVRRIAPPANLVVTNMRGSAKPMYLKGARLVGTYPLALLMNGQALNVAVVGHDTVLNFGLISAPEGMPDPDVLWGHMLSEFKTLKKTASSQ